MDNQFETVSVEINAPVEKVWKCWTTPLDIMQWNIPFPTWHSPRVENDLRKDGAFSFRMEAKDGSEGFDHSGKYDAVVENELIEYTVNDGRKSVIRFAKNGHNSIVTENYQPEEHTPIDIQNEFVRSVLYKFKAYTEAKQ